MISIIIPFYNHYDLTHARLWELYKFVPDECEIILVNDASTDDTMDDDESGIAWWQKTVAKHKIRYHRNEVNLGFVGSMNVGASLADGDVLVLLSNDVMISGNFVDEIMTKINEDRNILIGNRIVDWEAGWNEIVYKNNKIVIPYCEGYLLACTKEVWDKLGGFDPIYSPSDYEDVCLSTTAQYLGIRLVALNSSNIRHIGAASYTYDGIRMERTKRNRELWLNKWNDKWDEIVKV